MKKATLLLLVVFCNSMFANNSTLKESNTLATSSIQLIRLEYTAPNGGSRELILGFTSDNSASDQVDYGYDAAVNSPFANDLNWLIEGNRYVIQGVGEFDNTKQYLFGLYNDVAGVAKIEVTSVDNFDTNIDIFIYDALLDIYTNINDTAYTTTIDAGNYTDRFYITFKEPTNNQNLITDTESVDTESADTESTDTESADVTDSEVSDTDHSILDTENALKIKYIKGLNQLKISVKNNNAINSVTIYNYNGHTLKSKQNINTKNTNINLTTEDKNIILHIITTNETIIKQVVLAGK